jgi:hypothetical protein
MNQLVPLPSRSLPVPALVAAAGDQARVRFLEFFAANIRNPLDEAVRECSMLGGEATVARHETGPAARPLSWWPRQQRRRKYSLL